MIGVSVCFWSPGCQWLPRPETGTVHTYPGNRMALGEMQRYVGLISGGYHSTNSKRECALACSIQTLHSRYCRAWDYSFFLRLLSRVEHSDTSQVQIPLGGRTVNGTRVHGLSCNISLENARVQEWPSLCYYSVYLFVFVLLAVELNNTL